MTGYCPQDERLDVLSGQCHGTIDFTLAFEDYILVLIPAAILLLSAPLRIYYISRRSIEVRGLSFLLAAKALFALCFVGFSFALVMSTAQVQGIGRQSEITAAVFSFLASLLAALLSQIEHSKSIRPSVLLQLYLIVAVITEAVHLRTVWLRGDNSPLKAICFGQLLSCTAFLIVESFDKESILLCKRKRSLQDVNDLFSQRLFCWLYRPFGQGYSNILELDDLSPLDEDLTAEERPRRFRRHWLEHHHHNPNVTLFRVIASALKYSFFAPVLPRLLFMAANFAQPFLIERFVRYIDNPSAASPDEGPLLVLATLLEYVALATFQSWYWQSVNRFQTKLRGCLVTSIHDKALRTRPNSTSSFLMLMNVDVEKVITGLRPFHEFWATLLSIGIALYLLQVQVGLSFLAPLLLLIILISFVSTNANSVAPKQKAWLAATQKRVSFVTDVVSSMKNVKMLGLVPLIEGMGTKLREDEVNSQRSIRKSLFLNLMISQLTFQFSALVTFGAFAIQTLLGGPPLTNANLFTSLSILKLFTTPLLGAVQWVPVFLQGLAGLERIQTYLITEEHTDQRIEATWDDSCSEEDPEEKAPRFMIYGRNLSCGYAAGSDVLHNISFNIVGGDLHIVTGSVGSGKSTLLKALIGEIRVSQGMISLAGQDIAFCDQQPWLWNGSIKNNIIGENDYDREWFNRVAWTCGLAEDFPQLPEGHESLAGSSGTALSGGQKNRISLARAVYSRNKLMVIDDVLSGLDNRTEALVFGRVFGPHGILKQIGCTTILATHSAQWLPYADEMIAIECGSISYHGAPSEAPSGLHKRVDATRRICNDTWSNGKDVIRKEKELIAESTAQAVLQEKPRPSRDMRIYQEYFRSLGTKPTIWYFTLCASSIGVTTVQLLFLNWWAAASPTTAPSLGLYAGVFTAITLIDAAIMSIWLWFTLIHLVARSSLYLHAKQWMALMRVSFASWGTSGDTGSITNRFSQDIALVDMQLSNAFINTTAIIFMTIASVALLIVASPILAVSIPFVLGVLFVIQKIYLRTSKQLRTMDLEAKAPLCTHFLETVAGVTTIKAFGWAEKSRARNRALLEQSQAPFYLLESGQNGLALVLNMVVAGLATVLVGIVVALADKTNAGYLGLAMLSLMDLGMYLEELVSSWTLLETSLGAVARITAFVDKMPEEEQGSIMPAADWMAQGHISVSGLTASYSGVAEPILKDVNLSVMPGTKIAICGRTGSGKSSLASALFGLLHINSGTITIDNTDVTQVSQDLLRSKMIALPQDPYFCPGTVRRNLALRQSDDIISDAVMLAALAKVGLLQKFEIFAQALESCNSALDVELTPSDMLTRGQQQLFAMARAMLSPGEIVVVDEATSGLDKESDKLVQKLLREEFKGRTIIAIAHRLDTIMDFDQVVIMDHGRIVEEGCPKTLVEEEGSVFGSLVRAAV